MRGRGNPPPIDTMNMPIIPLVVLTIVVAGVSIPLIYDSTIDYDQYKSDDWYYDDYRVLKNVESASGALEYITLSGVKYVHAVDIGEGSITYSDGHTTTLTVKKANLDVIIALGQSNNAYASWDPPTATCPEIGTAYYYGQSWKPITGDNYTTEGDMYAMVNTPGTSVIGDKAPAFCKSYYAHSNHKVYYISGACSGTSITTWQPGGTSYEIAKTLIATAMSCIDTDKFEVSTKGYTWIQGENDKFMSAFTYYDYFVAMNDAILSGGLDVYLDHCFISKLAEKYPGPCNGQMLIGKKVDTATIVTDIANTFTIANGMLASDDTHYTQAADNIIGQELGEYMTHYYYPWTPADTDYTELILVIPVILVTLLILVAVGMVVGKND